MAYFLFKTEPHTYSFETLMREKKTNWDQVRNFQARNVLNTCAKNDFALIYHSGDEKSVVGVAQITQEAYPDLDPEKKGDWVQVDLKYAIKLQAPVSLAQIKSVETLHSLPMIKQSQLSCMPIEKSAFEKILKLGKSWDSFQKLK